MNRNSLIAFVAALVAGFVLISVQIEAAKINRVDLTDNAGTPIPDNLSSVAQAGDDSTDTMLNDARTFLYFRNGSGAMEFTVSAQVSTVQTQFGELSVPDITVGVEANEDTVVVAAPAAYNNDTGYVEITYGGSDTSGAQIGAFKLPRR